MHGNDSRTMVKAHVVAGAGGDVRADASAERADHAGER